MPNKTRPRCNVCGLAMRPLYRSSSKTGHAVVKNAFYCHDDGVIAIGRKDPVYARLPRPGRPRKRAAAMARRDGRATTSST